MARNSNSSHGELRNALFNVILVFQSYTTGDHVTASWPHHHEAATSALAGPRRMGDGHQPKDIFYGEFYTAPCRTGRPKLRYEDVNKRDMASFHISPQFCSAPSPRGCFGGLSPPNKAPSPLKLERETLLISGVLVNFIMSSPPPHKRKAPRRTAEPPIENFLATVLVLLPIATDGVPLWVTNIDCRLQTTQKKNWEAPSSSSSTTGWAIVCGVWAKKAGNHWSIWIG